MKVTLGTIPIAGFLLIVCATARATTNSQDRVTVRIWDLSRIENETMHRAKKVVETVFDPIGIQILWVDCPVGDTSESLSCTAPIGANDISLRIYSRTKADFQVKGHSRGGSSLLLTPDGGKGIVYVFSDRAMEVSRIHKIPVEIVIGITVAHEIGHLMLPGQGHTLAGVMHAKLGANDWRLAAQGQLGFAATERGLIVAGIRARDERMKLASERKTLGQQISC